MPTNTVGNSRDSSKTIINERLCFDKNEFMKANFSVDEFLHKNRNAPSLEELRDNLGLYLKGLRASMIDLINEDYADFVNLSANLVGLDYSINTIQRPLEEFRDEIAGILTLIRENEIEIRQCLEQKRRVRELKRNLLSLKKVYESSANLAELLANQLNVSSQLQPVDLERAALELIQLRFSEKFCKTYMSEEQSAQLVKLEADVLSKLRTVFNDALKKASASNTGETVEPLERCLRIYITLDSCYLAEKVFRDDVVAPYMSAIITEHSLQNSPQGLGGVFGKVLNFISLHMTDLLRLTQYTDKLRGFNFLVESFWSDVEMRMETNMASIFAPGNSDVFYAKYKCTCDFMIKIEELLASEDAVRYFRNHKQTKSFLGRWNLPVYFQICFQEIAGQFEGTLEPLVHEQMMKDSIDGNAEKYHLHTFNAAHLAMQRCWTEGVYLGELFPKFYKLNVQILLRLSHWVVDVTRFVSADGKQKKDSPVQLNRMQILISLHTDLQTLIVSLVTLQQTVEEAVPMDKQSVKGVVQTTLNKSFANIQQIFQDNVRSVQSALVDLLLQESGLDSVRQVNDLPRLYRKTNREVPSRTSTYIDQLLRPLKAFAQQHETNLGKEVIRQVLGKVFGRITTDYCSAVADVLTSVQKTEESLRRLRNLKATGTGATGGSTSNVISDDDKIRMQLRVDVNAWTMEATKLGFTIADIEKLTELNTIVEESLKGKEIVINN